MKAAATSLSAPSPVPANMLPVSLRVYGCVSHGHRYLSSRRVGQAGVEDFGREGTATGQGEMGYRAPKGLRAPPRNPPSINVRV